MNVFAERIKFKHPKRLEITYAYFQIKQYKKKIFKIFKNIILVILNIVGLFKMIYIKNLYKTDD